MNSPYSLEVDALFARDSPGVRRAIELVSGSVNHYARAEVYVRDVRDFATTRPRVATDLDEPTTVITDRVDDFHGGPFPATVCSAQCRRSTRS
jgi:enamine deaminase RidA (YjgF/YER057c/UK114 family)